MGKLETIDRIAYMNDMRILYEKTLKLEEKVEYLMDKVSKYDVEQLDETKDIKIKPAETKKKTNKKVK